MVELQLSQQDVEHEHQELEHADLIIIGGGPGGSSAALYAARAGLKTIVIDKALSSGALGITHKIANYPGIPEELSGAELVKRMREQAKSFGANYLQEQVIGLNLDGRIKQVYTGSSMHRAPAVIIATGSLGRSASLTGEAELLGRGVSYCATCDAPFFKGKEVAVVGSNEEAAQEALHLSRFAREVHVLTPKREMDIPKAKADQLSSQPNIKINAGTRVREILGETRVEGLRLADDSLLKVDGVFLYLQGNQPATEFLAGYLDTREDGCLIVDKNMATNIEGLYAVGDVVCDHVKQAVVAASDGAVAAMAADAYLHDREGLATDWS